MFSVLTKKSVMRLCRPNFIGIYNAFPSGPKKINTMSNLCDFHIPIPFHEADKEYAISEIINGLKLVDPRYFHYESVIGSLEFKGKQFYKSSEAVAKYLSESVDSGAKKLTILIVDSGRTAADSIKEASVTLKEATGKLSGKLNEAEAAANKSANDINTKWLKLKGKLPGWQIRIAEVLQNVQDFINSKVQPKK